MKRYLSPSSGGAITAPALLLIVLLLVLSSGTVAAQGTDLAAAPVAVTDALGREVRLDRPPERIVTAGRAVLMIADVLYAFEEAPERLVGVGRIRQGRANFLPAIDRDYGEKTILEQNVGPEQIAALTPDLVILKTFMREPLGRRLERLGIPVVYVELENPEQYQRDIMMLGALLGEEDRAREITGWYHRRTEEIESRTRVIPTRQRPETLLIYYRRSDGDTSFQVPPSGWIQTRLVESAGGIPVWEGANAGGGWGTVSFEQIAAWNPEEIFLVAYDGTGADVRDRLTADPRWQALAAVREGRFHAFPGDFYSWDQPDTRWILGLEWLAGQLHPDLFTDRPIEATMREFFREMYRLDETEFGRIIEPMLTGDLD
jgi:iron complex transport system substrate-binding protein